jgi:hypothetical protein
VTTNERAPISAAIAALSGDTILRFLAKQRWFAAKGASPTSARVASVVVMPWGNGEFAIARQIGRSSYCFSEPSVLEV